MIDNKPSVSTSTFFNIQNTNTNIVVNTLQLELNNSKSTSTLQGDSYVPVTKVKKEPFADILIPKAIPFNRPDSYTAPVEKESGKADELHFFYFSDSHSRFPLMNKFIESANRENPEFILDGGDIVQDGTEPELDMAYADRKKLNSPLYMVTGNHDVDLRGPFTKPAPTLPPFRSFDFKGAHFIMIDNENQYLPEKEFKLLEADLEKNKNKPIIVSMHVPPLLSKESLLVKVTKKLPLNMASPSMKDKEEIERFTSLMSKYKVSAVFTGHTHKADDVVKDGVKYITSGATGGLTPGMGIQNEYLDIQLKGREIEVHRIQLKEGPANPASFIANTMDYYSDLNSFNHEALGWNYVPTASVQYKAGGKVTETKHGESASGTVTASMEKENGRIGKSALYADLTLGVGEKDLNGQVAIGYKYRVIGDYNKNIFVAGSGSINAGIVTGKMSAGVGIGISAGAEYKNMTLAVGHEWATNYKATTATVGYRF